MTFGASVGRGSGLGLCLAGVGEASALGEASVGVGLGDAAGDERANPTAHALGGPGNATYIATYPMARRRIAPSTIAAVFQLSRTV